MQGTFLPHHAFGPILKFKGKYGDPYTTVGPLSVFVESVTAPVLSAAQSEAAAAAAVAAAEEAEEIAASKAARAAAAAAAASSSASSATLATKTASTKAAVGAAQSSEGWRRLTWTIPVPSELCTGARLEGLPPLPSPEELALEYADAAEGKATIEYEVQPRKRLAVTNFGTEDTISEKASVSVPVLH